MDREPMSDSAFKILIRTMESADRMGESRTGLAYTAIGAFEALCNMTDEQIKILGGFIHGD